MANRICRLLLLMTGISSYLPVDQLDLLLFATGDKIGDLAIELNEKEVQYFKQEIAKDSIYLCTESKVQIGSSCQ